MTGVAQAAFDVELILRIYKLAGFAAVHFKNYPAALRSFKRMNDVADENQELETKIDALKHLGYCY